MAYRPGDFGRQKQQGWRAGVIDRLAADLRLAFPDLSGFAARNLRYPSSFRRTPASSIFSPPPTTPARDLERGLLDHLRQFLLELGASFAFLGRQYRLDVGGDEFFVDLLFYHCRLHRYVVVDLKTGAIQPKFAGKINLYLSATDDLLRDPQTDQPSIGRILCRDKNRFVVEYALRDLGKPIGVANAETRLQQSLPEHLRGSLPTNEEIERELERTENGEPDARS